MNPYLDHLQPYPFTRLNTLLNGINTPDGQKPITLSIGEPKHMPPDCVIQCLRDSQSLVSQYPSTRGTSSLREAISLWLKNRFSLKNGDSEILNPESQVLPVNGTREALFAICQCITDRNDRKKNLVLLPNPFYQIYEGATYLAGLKPEFYNTTRSSNYSPDFDAIDDDIWAKCQMIYICTPGNPTGAVISESTLIKLINKAEQFNFTILSDECYSEIYFDEDAPPCGLLQAANRMGNNNYKHCLVFHSLSKRSNLPGLRSGFVAGNEELLKQFLLYRTYHGCAMSVPTQTASTLAWQDEQHVVKNRQIYKDKFTAVVDILQDVLPVKMPDASFYLWPELPIDDRICAQALYRQYTITVLPGSFLSRESQGINPGDHHIRIALVADKQDCIDAAYQIKHYIESL